MALTPAETTLIAAFDAATDKIAARIQKLIDQLTAAGELTPEAVAAFQAEVDKLNALGQDPANPIPPTP